MFHLKLNMNSECTYSFGWLDKFKERHGIRRLKSSGEKGCADYESATMFVDDLDEITENEQLTTEQIHNADETSLFWNRLNILLKRTRNPSREAHCYFVQMLHELTSVN